MLVPWVWFLGAGSKEKKRKVPRVPMVPRLRFLRSGSKVKERKEKGKFHSLVPLGSGSRVPGSLSLVLRSGSKSFKPFSFNQKDKVPRFWFQGFWFHKAWFQGSKVPEMKGKRKEKAPYSLVPFPRFQG